MIDISQTTAPKSDQMNADDLIGGPRTIKVTRVALKSGDDQPIAIYFEGDNNKPYKPCKSMRRVLMSVWGTDGTAYAGRRMTLYRDDTVQFGGQAVGGIRISHVSDIDRARTMPLTMAKARRALYAVKPLPDERGSGGGLSAAPASSTKASARFDIGAPPKGFDLTNEGWNYLTEDAFDAASKGPDALRAFRSGLSRNHDRALDKIGAELDRRADVAADRLDRQTDDHSSVPGDPAIEANRQSEDA